MMLWQWWNIAFTSNDKTMLHVKKPKTYYNIFIYFLERWPEVGWDMCCKVILEAHNVIRINRMVNWKRKNLKLKLPCLTVTTLSPKKFARLASHEQKIHTLNVPFILDEMHFLVYNLVYFIATDHQVSELVVNCSEIDMNLLHSSTHK